MRGKSRDSGKLRIGDDGNAIRIIALSRTSLIGKTIYHPNLKPSAKGRKLLDAVDGLNIFYLYWLVLRGIDRFDQSAMNTDNQEVRS
jgi:hypothetical protein